MQTSFADLTSSIASESSPRTALSLITVKLRERGKSITPFQLLPIKLDLQCCFFADYVAVVLAFLYLFSILKRELE